MLLYYHDFLVKVLKTKISILLFKFSLGLLEHLCLLLLLESILNSFAKIKRVDSIERLVQSVICNSLKEIGVQREQLIALFISGC
jgi:hypothetical protein